MPVAVTSVTVTAEATVPRSGTVTVHEDWDGQLVGAGWPLK